METDDTSQPRTDLNKAYTVPVYLLSNLQGQKKAIPLHNIPLGLNAALLLGEEKLQSHKEVPHIF